MAPAIHEDTKTKRHGGTTTAITQYDATRKQGGTDAMRHTCNYEHEHVLVRYVITTRRYQCDKTQRRQDNKIRRDDVTNMRRCDDADI